jgi:hypothetical protein
MDRKTKKITLPSGKTAEVKEFMNAGERNELRNTFLKSIPIDPVTGQPKGDVFAADLLEKGNQKLIEILVVSYDGSDERIAERLNEGTPEDYDFLIAELNKLSTGGFQKAK